MEVNGRFWGSLPLAVAAGMDFPLYAWQLSQGIDAHRRAIPNWACAFAGRRARSSASPTLSRSETSGCPSRSATSQLLADFRPGTRSAMWSWRDPAPAVQEVGHVLGRWTKERHDHARRARSCPTSLLATAKAVAHAARWAGARRT